MTSIQPSSQGGKRGEISAFTTMKQRKRERRQERERESEKEGEKFVRIEFRRIRIKSIRIREKNKL